MDWIRTLINSLDKSEIANLIKYLWENKKITTSISNLPPSAHQSRVLDIISKVDKNFDKSRGGQWRERLDSWFSQKGITREIFLDSVLGYYYGGALRRFIEKQEKDVDEKKAVRGRTENGSLVYLTPFRLVVEYEDGIKIRKVRGGELIPPPSIRDVFLSIADSYLFGGIGTESFLGTTDFISGAPEVDPIYDINSTTSFSQSLSDDNSFFASEPFMVAFTQVTGSIIDSAINLLQLGAESTDESTAANLIIDAKYVVYAALFFTSISNYRKASTAKRLVGKTPGLTPTEILNLEAKISKEFKHLDHVIHNFADYFKYSKGIAVLSTGEVAAALIGIATTFFLSRIAHNGSVEAAAVRAAVALGRSSTLGVAALGWTTFGIAITIDLFVIPKVQEILDRNERERRMSFATSRGWAPAPYADYGVIIPLAQFGMSPSFAIHREFLRKIEVTKRQGRLIFTADYIRENGLFWDPYSKSYIKYLFADSAVLGNIPEGDWPLSFYPEIEVIATNEGIVNYINSEPEVFAGYQPIPGPILTADDIISLFDIETYGIVGNTDWTAIAEEAAAAGFVNQSDLESIKDYQSFMEEAEKDVQLPDGSIVPNVDFEDLEKTWSGAFINATFDDLETELISAFNQIILDKDLSSKISDTGTDIDLDGNGRIVSRGETEPSRVVVENRLVKDPRTKVKDNKNKKITSRSDKRKIISKKRNPKIKIKNPTIRSLVPTPPNQRPKPKTPRGGRVLTQAERNIRRSRSRKNYNGTDKDIESIINNNIPVDAAPNLRDGGSGTSGGGGTRTGGGGGGGTPTGGGQGGGGQGGAGSTCFPRYAKVHTPTGQVEILNLSIGDIVYCFDEFDENLKILESRVTAKFEHTGEEQSDVYRYTFTDGSFIDVTKNHSVFTQNRKFEQIGNLQEGDSVLNLYGKQTTISSVKHLGKMDIYNIEVDKYHTYICDEILVHNALKTDPRLSGGGPTVEDGPDRGGGGGTTGGGTTGGGTTGGGETPPKEITCFPSWTIISTPNESIQIKDIKLDDIVTSYDIDGNITASKISYHKKHDESEMTEVFRYMLSDNMVLDITDNHAVLNNKNEFVQISTMKIGDFLIKENGKMCQIISKESLGNHIVYNICTENYGTYIANGIRVYGHDWYKPRN